MSAVEVGVLYAFISYIARVVEPLIQITMQFSGLQQAVVASRARQRAAGRAGAPEHAAGRRSAGRGARGAPAVRIRDLTFGYAPGQPVLHDLQLDIAAGRLLRHRRPHRQRQVDPAVAAAALLPAPAGQHRDRRPAARRHRQRALPRRGRTGAAGPVPAGRVGAREHRHGPRPDAGRRSKRRRARRTRTTSSRRWNRATTRRWAKAARACRPGRSS